MADTTPAPAGPLTDGMHYMCDALHADGVDTIFGVIGIPVTDLARIWQGQGHRFIAMRHEADAANAAAATGFLTGRPGVFLTVSAPGFLNGLASLKEATENGWPLIQIGGSSIRSHVDLEMGEYEGLDQRAYAVPFAKDSFRIDKIEDIPLGVARAIRTATSGRPGGVYVDFPDDLAAQTMDAAAAQAALWTPAGLDLKPVPQQASIDQALTLLENAEHPWILLGKGAAIAQAEDEVKAFIEATNIPYQPMSMAKGLLPDNDPHSTASCRGLAMRTADVVLVIGARLNWMLNYGEGRHWNPDVKFIQIDIDGSEFDNARQIACPVLGDIKEAMRLMNAGLAAHKVQASQEWRDLLAADTAKNNAKFGGKETADTVPMNHYNALGVVNKVLSQPQYHDVYLTNEGANTLDDCRDIVDIWLPRHRLDCGTWGVMGVGLSYAIGAAVQTGRPVVSISGDSAFGFSGLEVETVARFGLPIVIMVLNNGGIYRGDFKNLGTNGEPSPLTLSATGHYEKLGEAFGMPGYYVATPAELESALSEALASGKPAFINVQLSVHAGVESGHIGDLNPKPVVGPLATSECVDLTWDVIGGKVVKVDPATDKPVTNSTDAQPLA